MIPAAKSARGSGALNRPGFASSVLRIVQVRGTLLRRWIAEHAFILFVLGPILVGVVLWTTEQYLVAGRDLLAERLAADAAAAGSAMESGWVGWTLVLLLALVLWPGSLREAFGVRPGEDLLDALPVAENVRFAATGVVTLLRGVGPALLLLAAAISMAGGGTNAVFWAGELLLATCVVAVLDLAAAHGLARLGWLSGGRLLLLAGGAVVAASVSALRPLLAPLWLPARLVESVLARSLGVAEALPGWMHGLAVGEMFTLLALTAVLSLGWRRRDLERVAQITRSSRRVARLPLPGVLERRIDDRLGPAVTASLRRDLRLVLRRFSPVVPLALAVALVASALAVRLATDGTVVDAWRAEMLVAGFVVATLAVASIVPFLLADQLPQMWIERSTGVSPQQVWWGKAMLAMLLAVVPITVGVVLLVVLLPPSESVLAGVQLVSGGAVVASMVGASVFEIAEEPRLGLILASFPGLALACLVLLYPVGIVLWLAAGVVAVGAMVGRSARRIRFTDVPR